MKIFISSDIEGVAGVVNGQQGQPGNAEYETARRLMTAEVNAAIEGALAGGATDILVNDSHGDMRNLLAADLHPAASVILGKPKPMSMMQGLDQSFAGAFCLGYHSRARSRGILAHTINGFAFGRVVVNGRELGESGLYGALAGSLGVPVILLSGDDALAEEARALFPEARFAEVKQALGNRTARALSVKGARDLIRARAEEAVRAARTIPPLRLEPPFRCELELNTPALADLMALLPGTERLKAETIAFPAATILDVIRTLNCFSAMSAMLR